jgi:hypothetical protein
MSEKEADGGILGIDLATAHWLLCALSFLRDWSLGAASRRGMAQENQKGETC